MELKQATRAKLNCENQPSNCTNMELKHVPINLETFLYITSNCTNMELKLPILTTPRKVDHLLIAPIWN